MSNNALIRLTVACILLFALLPASAQDQSDKLDIGLAQAKGYAPVFVRMEDQFFKRGGDYERFSSEQEKGVSRLELREEVVQTLKEKSDLSFAGVRDELDRLIEAGHIRGLQRYWIVNGYACEATREGRQAMADLEAVGFVYLQRYGAQHRTEDLQTFEPDVELNNLYKRLLSDRQANRDEPGVKEGQKVPWHLKAVGADKAWEKHRVTGKGVIVAVLDDGMMTVPTLLPALWHNPKEKLNGKDDDGNGYVDDVFGYDFRANTPYPVTPIGHRHGTLCAGIIAARPTPGDKPIATSVAPGATIMPLVGNGQLRAYEYALDNGADVLSMSYTFEPIRMGQYRGVYRTAHEHLAAAGVVSVGGAGNYAQRWPAGKQIGSPKDIPCVIAAGGVGRDGEVSAFSSRGPVSWKGIRYYDDDDNHEIIKPDVTSCNAGFAMWTHQKVWVGPRAGRLSEVFYADEGGYVLAVGPRGNSFAGPHAAGVAALMLEANPDLPVWELQRIMQATCNDMGQPGRDTTHGEGMLQADRAVQAVLDFKAQ